LTGEGGCGSDETLAVDQTITRIVLTNHDILLIQATRVTGIPVRNYGWQTGSDYSSDTRNFKRANDLVPKGEIRER
jgi:hypothetical protein